MTVKELINELSNFNPNMEVKFAYDYGDYWNTEVAKDVRRVEEGQTQYSDYHRMDKVVDDGEYDNIEPVVILS